MSISASSRVKALRFFLDSLKQANPSINTNVGSVIRSLMGIPYSFLNAQLFNDIDDLEKMSLANADQLTESDMDILASNLLVSRPQGTKSIGTVRVYPSTPSIFSLSEFPYFSNIYNQRYIPIRPTTFTLDNYQVDDDGQLYVNVPVISENVGLQSSSLSGEISRHTSLPIKISKVYNPEPTSGGESAMNNSEFYDYISSQINNSSLLQNSSIVSQISPYMPTAQSIQVIDSSNPLMIRDELWTSDGLTPNLDREGSPFSSHVNVGSINFGHSYGRGLTASSLTAYVGRRIHLPGDIELFRTILSATDDYIVVSGVIPDGTFSDCLIYGNGPKVKCTADVYAYIPSLEIKNVIINNSESYPVLSYTSTYIEVAYQAEIGKRFVIDEGTDNEQIFAISGVTENSSGTYRVYSDNSIDTSIVESNSTATFYDMIDIEIPEKPCIYVMRIDELDPSSLETVRQIPQSGPGTFDEPGWYFSNSDPAYIFSTRESRTITIDDKRGNPRYEDLLVEGIRCTATSKDGGSDVITDHTSSNDFSNFAGRAVTIIIDEQILSIPEVGTSSSGTAVFTYDGVEGSTNTLNVNSLDAEYIIGDYGTEGIEGQKNVYVKLWDSGPSVLGEYKNAIARGDKLINPSGAWPSGIASLSVKGYGVSSSVGVTAFDITPTPASAPAVEYDSITTDVTTYSITVIVPDGIPIKWNNDDKTGAYCDLSVIFTKAYKNYCSRPVRIVYATSSEFLDAQEYLDENRSPANDIMVRSFFPSIIDTEITYRGSSSTSEIRDRFIGLISSSVRSTASNDEFILDVADVISTLDTESPGDWFSTKFEVRVVNFLKDGKFEVRYLNPSTSTKFNTYVSSTASSSSSTIVCKKTSVIPASNGKLFLGGNNPSTQETVVYESVVEGDDTYTYILRSATSYSHPQWETVYVSSLDYDPDLEYLNETIVIPAGNKPYVRNLIVTRLE